MKSTKSKIVTSIKTLSIACLAAIVCSFSLAMKTKKMVADLWQQLGISQPEAHRNILESFARGYLSYYGAKNAKNILANNRVAMVNDLVAYSKKYIASDQFKKEYESFRKKNKPAEPTLQGTNVDSIRVSEKAFLESEMKQNEENINSPYEKVRTAAASRRESLKKQLDVLNDPNNPTMKQTVDDIKRFNEAAIQQHLQKMKQFESEFPADPRLPLKRNLQAILDMTADVDYNAELKEAYKKKVFVNPVYERKPPAWKLAFRAGKETTDAVRVAAKKWLEELK
jgi:DNA-binding Lrp family transcriptional regulator